MCEKIVAQNKEAIKRCIKNSEEIKNIFHLKMLLPCNPISSIPPPLSPSAARAETLRGQGIRPAHGRAAAGGSILSAKARGRKQLFDSAGRVCKPCFSAPSVGQRKIHAVLCFCAKIPLAVFLLVRIKPIPDKVQLSFCLTVSAQHFYCCQILTGTA